MPALRASDHDARDANLRAKPLPVQRFPALGARRLDRPGEPTKVADEDVRGRQRAG